MTPQALNSCKRCALKKRKCDRAYPVCSRCSQSKLDKECVYESVTAHGACERCRTSKRACGRELPVCSRCRRLGVSCEYVEPAVGNLPHELVAQAHEALLKRRLLFSSEGINELQLTPQYPVPVRSHFPLLIHHYCEASLLPATHRLPNSLTTHLHTTWMNRAMVDPCLFHATLFCASAHLDLLQGKPHNRITVFHQSCALMALRERLKGGQISYETAATALTLIYYNMTAFDTESALIHKQGVLRMLAMNKDRGPDFMALAGLVNLILLGLAVVMNQQLSTSLAIIEPAESSSSTARFSPRPSSLLSRALLRARNKKSYIITSTSLGQLQGVLDFTIAAEHNTTSQPVSHLRLISTSEQANPDVGPSYSTSDTFKATHNINQCIHLACSIFWSLLRQASQPVEQVPESDPSTTVTATATVTTALSALRGALQILDGASWQKHAPELYIWICLTAAAACDTPSARIPFITAVTPIVSASDSAELVLTRDSWRYFEWVAGFRCRQRQGGYTPC